MRNSLLTAAAGLLFATSASAAALNVPTNVRVVQKSNTDLAGRIYPTIQAALASIPTTGPLMPSPANPYLVKVMPGTYDLGTQSLQMRQYVDIEGGGPENTVIVSSISGDSPDGGDCSLGTVMMANSSVLRQIKVVNSGLGSTGGHGNAVNIKGVSARAEFVHAISFIPPVGIPGGLLRRIGFCVEGLDGEPAAVADLVHVYAEGNNLGDQGNAIRLSGAVNVTVTDSRLVAKSDVGSAYVINSSGGEEGFIELNDCALEGSSERATALWLGRNSASVSNSRITLTGFVGGNQLHQLTRAAAAFTMANTTVRSDGTVTYGLTPGESVVTIANSQLPGDRSMLIGVGAKLVGNYDENFDPIPNQ